MKGKTKIFFIYCTIFLLHSEKVFAACLIGEDLLGEIKDVFQTICFVGLLLCIILGMLDFFRGITSGKEGELKAVATKFSKRLIAFAVLLILPELVEWFLNLAGLTNDCDI